MNLTSTPERLIEKVEINDAKLDDVYSLLTNRFGSDWRNDEKLNYFKQFYKCDYKPAGKRNNDDDDDEINEESDACSCCGEDDETFLL